MKNLLFNSLLLFSVILSSTCTNSNPSTNNNQETDTVQINAPDTGVVKGDTLQPAYAAGDTIKATSPEMNQTEPGTPVSQPGAVEHKGPKQSEIDSIKKAKTKGKRKSS